MEKKETIKKEMAKQAMVKPTEKMEVITVKKPDVVSATTTTLLNNIHKDLREVGKTFMRLGVSFYNFKEDRLYKELGYKTFDSFVKAEFNLSKATAYTFINVALKFSVVTPEGLPTGTLKKEFREYSSSQLVEMCRLDEDTIAKVKPTDTVREIKKLRENVQTSEQNEDGKKTVPMAKKKANEKDSRIPVNRLFVGTAYSFEEIAIHKKIIDLYMLEKNKKENKNYRVEINIIWDDVTDSQSDEVPGMNQPMEEPEKEALTKEIA